MFFTIHPRIGNLIGFLACGGLMGYALYAQYSLGLEPCPLCIFQRVAVITVGILFLIATLHSPARTGARVYAGLLSFAALIGMALAGRHLWIAAQPPGTVPACGAGLDYMMDILPLTEVVTKVLTGSGECGKIDWRFLGLSMPAWVLIALSVLAWWALVVNLGVPRKVVRRGI
jgi:disulfide bond formation protein DsbB